MWKKKVNPHFGKKIGIYTQAPRIYAPYIGGVIYCMGQAITLALYATNWGTPPITLRQTVPSNAASPKWRDSQLYFSVVVVWQVRWAATWRKNIPRVLSRFRERNKSFAFHVGFSRRYQLMFSRYLYRWHTNGFL